MTGMQFKMRIYFLFIYRERERRREREREKHIHQWNQPFAKLPKHFVSLIKSVFRSRQIRMNVWNTEMYFHWFRDQFPDSSTSPSDILWHCSLLAIEVIMTDQPPLPWRTPLRNKGLIRPYFLVGGALGGVGWPVMTSHSLFPSSPQLFRISSSHRVVLSFPYAFGLSLQRSGARKWWKMPPRKRERWKKITWKHRCFPNIDLAKKIPNDWMIQLGLLFKYEMWICVHFTHVNSLFGCNLRCRLQFWVIDISSVTMDPFEKSSLFWVILS